MASGDKQGNVSLWLKNDDLLTTSVVTHRALIVQLCFNPADGSKLISASFDGFVREFDVEATAFTELYAAESSITSLALGDSVYLVSCEDGSVVSLDQRESGRSTLAITCMTRKSTQCMSTHD